MELTQITEAELEIILFRHEQWAKGAGANLTRADLTDANLTGTDFTNATWVDGAKQIMKVPESLPRHGPRVSGPSS